MKKSLSLLLTLSAGIMVGRMFDDVGTAQAGAVKGPAPTKCSSVAGDVDASGVLDVTDAIVLLTHLFLGDPIDLPPLCETPCVAGPSLPDTGQTDCFDQNGNPINCASTSCQGQDGFFSTGCPEEGRFVDNGDGTVTDTCTSLMWQLDTADTNEDGRRTDEDVLLWCDALEFCADSVFAGFADWRLPNVRELQSIVDYGSNPAIPSTFGAIPFAYWSSTTLAFNEEHAWGVNIRAGQDLAGGLVDVGRKTEAFLVRAVRNAP